MSSLMIHTLEEKLDEKVLGQLISEENFSEPLLDVILQNLLKEVQVNSCKIFIVCISWDIDCFLFNFFIYFGISFTGLR